MSSHSQDTPPPATESTSPVRRGKHELLGDYLSRVDPRRQYGAHEGRHEAPTHNKLVAAYAPTDPEGIARMEADARYALGIKLKGELGVDRSGHFEGSISHTSPTPSQARITRYKNMAGGTNEAPLHPIKGDESYHPSWALDPCPYSDGHKIGCVWGPGVTQRVQIGTP